MAPILSDRFIARSIRKIVEMFIEQAILYGFAPPWLTAAEQSGKKLLRRTLANARNAQWMCHRLCYLQLAEARRQ